MDLASVVAALASVGVRVSGSTPNNNIQEDSSRACPTGLAGPEPSGTHNDPGQHFQGGGSNTTHALLSPDPETLPIGEHVSPSHRRVPANQGTPRPTHSGSLCSLNGRSQLPSEPEIRPRYYPLGVGS